MIYAKVLNCSNSGRVGDVYCVFPAINGVYSVTYDYGGESGVNRFMNVTHNSRWLEVEELPQSNPKQFTNKDNSILLEEIKL